MNTSIACNICGNIQGNQEISIPEQFFGTREEFLYLECAVCKGAELLTVPHDLSIHYPYDYYSFTPRNIRSFFWSKRLLKIPFVSLYLATPRGRWRSLVSYFGRMPKAIAAIARMRIKRSTSILDVGCGSGEFLLRLQRYGFNRLLGVDPFLESDIAYSTGLTIKKCEMKEIDASFDVVMSHHVFEHLPDPREALREMVALTKPGGYIFIRMPNNASFAQHHYGIDWVGWDAPRHLHIHTPKTVEILAKEQGLEVVEIFFDSDKYQFTVSELWVQGRPLAHTDLDVEFSQRDREAYQRMSNALDELGSGNEMCVILRKPADKS